MKHALVCSIAMAVFSVSSAVADPLSEGERIAATCAGCHGTRGASPGAHIPVIGGQTQNYLKQAMKEYRDGSRPGGVMVSLAKGYSDSQIEQLSAVIGSWKWRNSPLAKKGTISKNAAVIESCAACHGAKGEGTEMAPHIAGQAPGYLKDSLLEYKLGVRKSSDMELIKEIDDKKLDLFVTIYSKK